MAWDTLDLSSVTDTLIGLLDAAQNTTPLWTVNGGPIPKFTISATGLAPDIARTLGGCQLSLCLMHVAAAAAWRNTPTVGTRALVNAQQPMALELSYLLTAFADKDYHQEQQAMSIALACFHATPIHKTPSEEYSLTIETASLDEMSRLWQSVTVPMRVSALFRVSVIFLRPRDLASVPAAPPRIARLSLGPAVPGAVPTLLPPAETATFTVPVGATPDDVTIALSDPVAVPGVTLLLGGDGLDRPEAAEVYLSTADGVTEWTITAWRTRRTASEIVLVPPNGFGVPPVGLPPPGVYRIAVGRDVPRLRSATVELSLGPRIDGVAAPFNLIPDGGGTYTINGAGFTPGATQVLVDTAAVDPSQVTINAGGTSIGLKLPLHLPSGARLAVRVRVANVEAPPAWWIVVP